MSLSERKGRPRGAPVPCYSAKDQGAREERPYHTRTHCAEQAGMVRALLAGALSSATLDEAFARHANWDWPDLLNPARMYPPFGKLSCPRCLAGHQHPATG